MRQLRCAKIFVWPIWPRAMTKSQLTRGKIGVSTHPGSVVIHVHDEDGVRTKPGGPRRLKINLSLMTGHATCVYFVSYRIKGTPTESLWSVRVVAFLLLCLRKYRCATVGRPHKYLTSKPLFTPTT